MKTFKMPIIGSLTLLASCTQGVSNKGTNEAQKDRANQFQNIVFIIGDDHATHAIGCYGNEIVKTPNLDKLAKNGTRFTRAYANSPICSASRQSILTGRYPHATKVNLLSTPFPEEEITIADHLSEQGYVTGVVGKTHFNNNLSHGFQEVLGKDYKEYLTSVDEPTLPDSIKVRPKWNNHAPAEEWLNAASATSGHYEKYDQTTYYTNKAIDFISRHKNEKFCLWIGYHEPHAPFNFPVEYQGKYSNINDLPHPKGYDEDDRHVPEIFKNMSVEDEIGVIRSYYTSVEYLDKNIGNITQAIENMGLTESTLIVYIGDHGYMLHHHKRFEKHSMWEEAVNSPLIISGFGKNRVLNQYVEYVDLVPSLLDIVGAKPLETAQGKSLLPLLTEESNTHRNYAFAEFLPDNKVMVRNDKWKLIYTTGKKDLALGYQTGFGPLGENFRLYDIVNDPKETTNLANKEEYKTVVDELKLEMIKVFAQTHCKADSISKLNDINEQLKAYCVPLDVGHKGY